MLVAGDQDAVARCRPLLEAIPRRTFEAGPDPVAAAAIKIANNFVLGCAIEAMGEGFSLDPQIRRDARRFPRRDDRRPVRLLGL